MKRKLILSLVLSINILLCGYSGTVHEIDTSNELLKLDTFKDYQKLYKSEKEEVCAVNKTKSYMDYRAITAKGSTQYKYIQEYMTIDEETGFLVDKDGFIGVALGSFYGVIGDRYYFTLDSGVVLPLVKVEEKADKDTYNGCYHMSDSSVIEFVIDTDYARASEVFNKSSNGLINSGNFNNYSLFKGEIKSVEKVTDELNPNYVEFVEKTQTSFDNKNIFNYASGY